MSEVLQPTREGDLTFCHATPFCLEAGGALQPVEVGVHERGPASVSTADHVRDEDMPVQKRVPGA